MEWTLRKMAIPKGLARSVMSLYDGAETRVKLDSELSEELVVIVGMHQTFVLPPLLLAGSVDVVTELSENSVLTELLYLYDLTLMRVG